MSVTATQSPDPDAWNGFVQAQPGGSLYQSYEWGQIRRGDGWTPHYLAVVDHGRRTAAALVLVKRLPGEIGSLLYSPCGPVTEWPSRDGLERLLCQVRELAQAVGGVFWRIEPRAPLGDPQMRGVLERAGFREVSQEWSYWNRPRYDMHLRIGEGESAVFSRISSRTRGKIRYASKQGVVVEAGCGDRDVETFYRLLLNTGRKKRIPVRALDYFKALYWTLEKAGMGRLFVARKEGEPVAAGLSSRFGGVASLLYLGSDYSVKYAGWAVEWEMIRWAISQGCEVYDMAGTGTSYPPNESDKGYGVYQFKRSFGAEIVAWYGYADYVLRPGLYQLFRALERSLPYGERMFLDWPKTLLAWTRGHRTEPAAA